MENTRKSDLANVTGIVWLSSIWQGGATDVPVGNLLSRSL